MAKWILLAAVVVMVWGGCSVYRQVTGNSRDAILEEEEIEQRSQSYYSDAGSVVGPDNLELDDSSGASINIQATVGSAIFLPGWGMVSPGELMPDESYFVKFVSDKGQRWVVVAKNGISRRLRVIRPLENENIAHNVSPSESTPSASGFLGISVAP